MKLVHNARRAWTWFSVQAMALSGAAGAAWLAVPADMKKAIPDDWLAIAGVALAVLGIVGRLVQQKDGD